MDQPRSPNRDERITPNEAPECRSQNSGFKCLSDKATRIWLETGHHIQSQRAGNLFRCFEIFQQRLTNMPRCSQVVNQEDCRFIQPCPPQDVTTTTIKTKMTIHMYTSISTYLYIYVFSLSLYFLHLFSVFLSKSKFLD